MIRKAKEEDYPRLAEIWESAVKATHDFLSEEDFLFYQSKILFFLQEANNLHLLEKEDKILAFLAVNEGNIDMLFVDNKLRNNGLGSQLITFAIKKLQATAVDVNEQNEKAYGFYKHFGFKEISKSEKDDYGKKYPILHLSLL